MVQRDLNERLADWDWEMRYRDERYQIRMILAFD